MINKLFRLLILSLLVVGMMSSEAMAQVAILCYHEVDRPNDDFSVSSHQLDD